MTNGNDPDNDRLHQAADYAADNVDSQLAGMDLEELCKEFDISDNDLVEIIEDTDELKNKVCTVIRADEGYRQRMMEKLQEQHLAGEE